VNNTVLSGIIVGGVALAAAGAIMVNSGYNPLQQYATVVSVQPAFDTVRTPRPVCGDEATLAQAQAQAQAGATAAPGAPAPTAADESTPAPAAQPALTPAQSAAAMADAGAKPGEGGTPECVVVYDTSNVDAGFDVTYELDGQQKVVRMDRDPGRRIPVEDGELVLTQS
jgi:uncharacterized protein YcfJ